MWTPQPQDPADLSIMEYATGKYDTHEIILLNRYHLYLQVISLYDIMLSNLSEIHPDIQKGECITTRESNIFWVNFPKPPKKAKQIWLHFLQTHVALYISSTTMEWNTDAHPNYTVKYF
jgi:hypothetical protein